MIVTSCGETVQKFHLNTKTCITTVAPLLLLFENKGIVIPYSKKAFAHPEPLPVCQRTGSSQSPVLETVRSFNHTDRQRLEPDNTEFKALSKALQYRTLGGKNEGLGWHTLHVTFASAFYCPLG